jgi:hypothetical protein
MRRTMSAIGPTKRRRKARCTQEVEVRTYIELHGITSVTITEISIFLNMMNSYINKHTLNTRLL